MEGFAKIAIFNFKLFSLLLLQLQVQIVVASNFRESYVTNKHGECQQRKISANDADFDSLKIYPDLHFKAKWTREYKHFWKSTEFDFESRYIKEMKHGVKSQNHHRVKAYVTPYSHTDPGWKETYEVYFYSLTKKILSNAVTKLTQYRNMTFAWSEISFLSKWWDEASHTQKESLRRLVKEGRFEILTGGWVMADEATTTLFALVNQLVEGHQWIRKHLNVFPTSAWSIDAFGHSSTMPYLLKKMGITGMMIQRVHYAWKHWFAEHRRGDFIWIPRWSSHRDGILCHNAHYDLYPTKHSCGPNPNICMRFDFRVLDGIREEHLTYVHHVDTTNIRSLADSLTGQYRRTASLTEHNVVIAPLGGDFRFEHILEWDQQHSNYNLLFDYINSRQNDYAMQVKFGTLSDYFQGVKESNKSLSSFSGDLFPYADVIFPFAPGYWTGYYSTRPFWKKLSRETEDELLKAEILFTFSYNLMHQRNYSSKVLFRNYDNLVHARRSLALFQHHDGITGTSPRSTMLDYARKLTQAWNFCRQIQRLAIASIWANHLKIRVPTLIPETERKSFTKMPEKIPVRLYQNSNMVKKVVIFNCLPWKRSQLVRLMMSGERSNIVVKGSNGDPIAAQVISDSVGENAFEILFQANLPGLSIVTFELCSYSSEDSKHGNPMSTQSTISCTNCKAGDNVSIITKKEITLDNGKIKVEFDNFGLLTRIERTSDSGTINANITLSFGRYEAIYGSGAYLLHPYTSSAHSIIDETELSTYVVHGPVTSEVTMTTAKYSLRSWILHSGTPEEMSVVYMTLKVNGTVSNGFGEYFMRFQSDLNNTEAPSLSNITDPFDNKPRPVFYTDTNGLSVEKRVSPSKLPYQANHFPITQFAFIQDTHKHLRLSLITDRSHGVSSVIRGRLETIFDRQLRYDDARGMDEGVLDTETAVTNYIVNLEQIPKEFVNDNHFSSWQPSLEAQKLSKCLNHQPTIFFYDALSTHKSGQISFFSKDFPDDVHLLNLRTLSESKNQEDLKSVPTTTALLVLQRLSHYGNSKPESIDNCNHQHKLLNTTININHSVKQTNLVGTMVLDGDNSMPTSSWTTKNIPVGDPHELSSYLIHF